MFLSLIILVVFFFFQAEDGIRDGHVTGVQTCALPIFSPPKRCHTSPGRGGARDRGAPFRRDRKSTRLNSSHVATSYAVFCLKKKKKDEGGDQKRKSMN